MKHFLSMTFVTLVFSGGVTFAALGDLPDSESLVQVFVDALIARPCGFSVFFIVHDFQIVEDQVCKFSRFEQ